MELVVVRVAAAVAFLLSGAPLARRSRRAATIACVPMLLLQVLRIPVSRIPAAEATLLPFDWYPHVELWWWEGPALFMMGAGLVVAWGSMWRRDAVLVGAGLLLGRLAWSAGELPGDHPNLAGTVDPDGLCLQTSGYSCSPAAAAALLALYGIEATEREMAVLCVTRPGRLTAGTTDAGIVRGLRRKFARHGDVRIAAPSSAGIPVPSMVSIRLTRWMAHSLVVEGIDGDEVRLNDPLFGRHAMPRERFEERWQGSAIWLEPFS